MSLLWWWTYLFSVFSFGFELGKFRVVSLPASWHHISSYPHWIGFLLAIKIHMNTTTFEVIAIRVCSFLASFGCSRHELQVWEYVPFYIQLFWSIPIDSLKRIKINIVFVIPFTFFPPLSNTHPISIRHIFSPCCFLVSLSQLLCSPLYLGNNLEQRVYGNLHLKRVSESKILSLHRNGR